MEDKVRERMLALIQDVEADDPAFRQVEAGFRLILDGLGVDLHSAHFKETPRRAARAWIGELCSGLSTAPPRVTTFPQEGLSQMILLRNIPVKSLCAHHLLPFIGAAHVAYIPGHGEVMGLSKLSRIVNYFSRRPQVQENLTNDIANFISDLVTHGSLGGVGVVIRANHMCMELRGVQHSGDMVTSALRGVFEEPEVRAEFLNLCKEHT